MVGSENIDKDCQSVDISDGHLSHFLCEVEIRQATQRDNSSDLITNLKTGMSRETGFTRIADVRFQFENKYMPTFKNLTSLCICQYSEGRSATLCKKKINTKVVEIFSTIDGRKCPFSF